MIKSILDAAALPYSEARFPDPPKVTYAIWFDEVAADGDDGGNRIFEHNGTIELYEPEPDDDAETSVEAQLNARGIHWTKQARYWLDSIRRYQSIYEFTYYEKRRV